MFCLLTGAIGTVLFGWVVQSHLSIGGPKHPLGRFAVEVASFPTSVDQVRRLLWSRVAGTHEEEAVSVRREAGFDYEAFSPVASSLAEDLPGLMMWTSPGAARPGWRMLVGAFQVDGEMENAVLLLSPELHIVRIWRLSEIAVGGFSPRSKHRKFVHGVEMLRDGSIVFAFDGGVSLQRFDACGRRVWSVGGGFHHAVTLTDNEESVWTLRDFELLEVSVADGSVLREIGLGPILEANPGIDILEIRRVHQDDLGENTRDTPGVWLHDPLHFNDVDPLPGQLADSFPEFTAGDLLVSARSLNLIFVVDPVSLKIKWWRMGAVQRQHDPDWLVSGEIGVLNNRMSRDYSEIVALDPRTFERRTLLDGRDQAFYTRIRGKQQILDDGALVITSPQQGRAFEVDANGERTLEVVNQKPGSLDTNYVVSEMRWYPPDHFETEAWRCSRPN